MDQGVDRAPGVVSNENARLVDILSALGVVGRKGGGPLARRRQAHAKVHKDVTPVKLGCGGRLGPQGGCEPLGRPLASLKRGPPTGELCLCLGPKRWGVLMVQE